MRKRVGKTGEAERTWGTGERTRESEDTRLEGEDFGMNCFGNYFDLKPPLK